MGALTICSDSACFRAPAMDYVNLSSLEHGKGTVVADIAVPPMTVRSLRFESTTGPSKLDGAVVTPKMPLVVEPGYQGGEVLVLFRQRADGPHTVFEPVANGSGLVHSSFVSIHYSPAVPLTAEGGMGTSLHIPAGALAEPQVFVLQTDDRRDAYATLSISPKVKFSKPAVAIFNPIRKFPLTNWLPPSDKNFKAQDSLKPAEPVRIEFTETGVIHGEGPLKSSRLESETIDVPGSSSCAEVLGFSTNQQWIDNQLSETGLAYIDWCIRTTPNVHIAIVNMGDSREQYSIPYTLSGPMSDGRHLLLKPITFWSSGSQIAVNGFTWSRDDGTAPDQLGEADGYMYSAGVVRGNNREGGGMAGGSGKSAGNKFVMGFGTSNSVLGFFEKSAVGASMGAYGYNTVSTSTSVVKGGKCTTDNLYSRWSAVGAVAGGRLVFISSTTEDTTTAAALCPLFKALGVQNALRLDGGPSAVMAINGQVLNPLQFPYSLKYGPLRNIAYALKVNRR